MARDDALPDGDLLRRAAGGDGAAFTLFVRRHEDRIFALALRITGDRSDALDAVQETFIAAYRNAGSFRGEAAASTWLYRIGINACKDLVRKRSRQPVLHGDASEAADEPAPGLPVADDVTLRLDLAEALAALPDDYRDAVVMHDLGGMPYEEIATATGAALGTVKSRISRGRRRLARLLEGDLEGPLEQPGEAPPSKDQT